MQSSEGTFQGDGNLELYYQSWYPEKQPKAILVIVHGVAEHSNRYQNLVKVLLPENIAIYSYDQRGHGSSPGRRGYLHSWDEYHSDFKRFLEMVHQREPDLPLFAYGHSQGALIILEYLLQDSADLAGIITSGPPLNTDGAASPLLVMAAKILSRVWPTYSFDTPLNPEDLSCDPKVVQAYRDDPTVFKILTARWGTEYLNAQIRARDNAAAITLPILILQGGEDAICDPQASQDLYDRVSSADKTLKIYPSYFHEVHNEPGHVAVIQDINRWINDHLPTHKPVES